MVLPPSFLNVFITMFTVLVIPLILNRLFSKRVLIAGRSEADCLRRLLMLSLAIRILPATLCVLVGIASATSAYSLVTGLPYATFFGSAAGIIWAKLRIHFHAEFTYNLPRGVPSIDDAQSHSTAIFEAAVKLNPSKWDLFAMYICVLIGYLLIPHIIRL